MEIISAVTICMLGVLIGIVAMDFRHRIVLTNKLNDAKNELDKTTATFAEEHNAMAKTVVVLQDTVNAHEFKLNGRSIAGLPNEVKR